MTQTLKAVKADLPIEVPQQLRQAELLRLERKPDEALIMCIKYMNENFDSVPALTLAAHIMIDCQRYGLAHPLLAHAATLLPHSSLIWNNLGLCYFESAHDVEEAEKCYIKSLARNPNDANTLNNIGQLYTWMGQPQKAVNCIDKAIRINPKLPEARYNKGVAQLMMRQWKEGWEGYEYNLGQHLARCERVFGRIPRWMGDNGLTVIAYGEQGVGDEISFASCIPDLQKNNKVVIECDKRLAGLFRRSFNCEVYGTRYNKQVEWPNSVGADAMVAMGSLPRFFRNSDEDFKGEPYLVADPQRRIMWRSMLDALGPKLKVGISWTGGIRKTGERYRSLKLKDLEPIWRQDATFISLQYKDAPETAQLEQDTGIKIHHWAHATQTQDMDDQASLMAELDLVITVQQTAVHIGGGLGVPTWVMIPKWPIWRYGLTGSDFPWAKSVKLYRQKTEWAHTIAEIATDLRAKILERAKNA